MSSARDFGHVPRHDDENLRRFVAARRSGDEAGARRYWNQLLNDNFERVRQMVRLESGGRLSRDEEDEAVQYASIRIATNMFKTFRGSSFGQWYRSTQRLVRFACIDTQRRAAARSKHERPLDEREGGDEDDRGGWDPDVYKAIEKRRREDEANEADAESLREGQEFLDWAVPQLSDKRRSVIELDRDDVPVEEIQRRLGMSRDSVYAARSRALKDLAELRKRYEQP